VESVGVHIINQKTILGALEEYLPWDTISDVFINEVISEVYMSIKYKICFVCNATHFIIPMILIVAKGFVLLDICY
jgi:hypothetical protein